MSEPQVEASVLARALDAGSRLAMVEMLLKGWIAKQGHAKCWYYPDIFRQLCQAIGLEAPETPAPPIGEFKIGCAQYTREVCSTWDKPNSIPMGLYRHFKGGNIYEVLALARSCENSQPTTDVVIYKLVGGSLLFTRSLHEFTETVTHEGVATKRFVKIDEPTQPL